MVRSGWLWPTAVAGLASTLSAVIAMPLTIAYTLLALHYLTYPRINCNGNAPLWFDFVGAGFLALMAAIVFGSTFGLSRLLRVDRTRSLRLVSVVVLPVLIAGWFLLKSIDTFAIGINCSD